MNKKDILIIIQVTLALIIGFIFIRQIFFYNVVISGQSMEPTLKNNQKFYVKKDKEKTYKRNDIIVFQNPENTKQELFIKRIIGEPGDKVIYKNNKIYINKKMKEELYIKEPAKEEPWITTETGIEYVDEEKATLLNAKEIPQDKYLVLGDNRNNSKDSRMFGYIDKKQIITKIN